MKIYISLPISGRDISEAKAEAEKWKKDLNEKGHEAITPFDICPEEGHRYSHYMGEDIKALIECDAVALCFGWEKSNGCMLEATAAKIYKKNILLL